MGFADGVGKGRTRREGLSVSNSIELDANEKGSTSLMNRYINRYVERLK